MNYEPLFHLNFAFCLSSITLDLEYGDFSDCFLVKSEILSEPFLDSAFKVQAFTLTPRLFGREEPSEFPSDPTV